MLAGTREKERNHDKGGRHRRTSSQGGGSIGSMLSPVSPGGNRRASIEAGRDSVSGFEVHLAVHHSRRTRHRRWSAITTTRRLCCCSAYTDAHLALSNPLHFTPECARFTGTLATRVKTGEEDNQTILRLKSLKLMYVGGPRA